MRSENGLAREGVVRLQNVFLHVTKACNLNCAYCYFSARKPLPSEMTTAELNSLWPDLTTLRPVKVVFTGGEPLLRDDILELLRGLRDADPDHHVLCCMNSNGHLVTPELARALVGLVDEVRISVDAMASRNDGLRGAGNFNAAIRALEVYYAVGFEPKVLVTVTRESLSDLEELLCFLIERKFVYVNVNRFTPIGRGKGHTEWQVSQAEVDTVIDRAMARFRPRALPRPEPSEFQHHCGAGQFLNIMPDGNVFPCHVLTQREFNCGNVRQESLLTICRRRGLLGALADLDFRDLVRSDNELTDLTRPGACMGEVYANTRSSRAWQEHLRHNKLGSFT